MLPKIELKPADFPKFAANELPSSYKLVYDAKEEDFYGDEFDCQIYELEPHIKTVQVLNYYTLKNPNKFYTLSFPYLQFTIYKKTLYATISKNSFVSPDYVGLYDIVFNHFLYGFVCLPYEMVDTFDTPYGYINKFYSTGNRIGDTKYNSYDLLKSWEEESKTKPNKVLFSDSVIWKNRKHFSLREMLTSSYEKPHQGRYAEYYKRYPLEENQFQNYTIRIPLRCSKLAAELKAAKNNKI